MLEQRVSRELPCLGPRPQLLGTKLLTDVWSSLVLPW